MTWCCALPSSNGAGGEEEEHTLFCYPPAAGNGADLKADRLSKYGSIGMKTHEVQISFCTGHLHKSSRAPVPFRWVSLFLPDTLMPNKPRCLQSPALYAAKPQKFHKAENNCGVMVAKESSLPPAQQPQLNTFYKISP